jgi:alkanesulfonate monooxygenase SsuD/methylene tetrahydromethanopterin reductase-like flavin-dependent oxidoreductase (luciferase family)
VLPAESDACDNRAMRYPLRFHVLLLPNVDWPELRDRVVWLEELGFEVAALADHFVDWTNPVVPWLESWTALAALAEATRTIRLATIVTQIPLRNPAMLARQVLTLDHISNGRIELGLGTGLPIDPSYAMAGLPNWDATERVDRFGEYVDLVGQLLAQEITTYEGRYYRAEGAIMNPRPVQLPRPPLLVAALAPRMLRHAARYADIWNSLSFRPTFAEQLTETRARCEAIDAECAAIGRDPATLRRSYTMFDAQARARGGTIGYYESVERFSDEVSQAVALGISDVGFYYPLDPAQRATFERIAVEALPRLCATFPAI